MKNLLLRIGDAFKSRWGRWMLGMFMSWAVVPVIVKAIIMCAVKKTLPDSALIAANAVGVIMSVIFGILMALSVERNKVRPYKILTGAILPWIAVKYGVEMLGVVLRGGLGTGGLFIAMAVQVILEAALLMSAVFMVHKPDTKKEIILNIIKCLVMSVVGNGIMAVAGYVSQYITIAGTWESAVLLLIVRELIRWIVYIIIIGMACGDGKAGETSGRKIPCIVSSVVSAAVVIAAVVAGRPDGSRNTLKVLTDDYIVRASNAYMAFVSGNPVGSMKEYDNIRNELDIWNLYISGEEIPEISSKDIQSNAMMAYLDIELNHNEDRLETMEDYYIKGYIRDNDFMFELLDEYDNQPELTKEQKNRRDEIIRYFVTNGIYRGGLFSAEDVKKNPAGMKRAIKTVQNYMDNYDYIEFLSEPVIGDIIYGPGITFDTVMTAMDKAVENPDDFVWNFYAVYFINTQRRPSAREFEYDYYPEETIVMICEQLENIFDKEYGNTASDESILELKKMIIRTYMFTLKTDKCADYCLDTLKKYDDGSVKRDAAYALYTAERYDECMALATDDDYTLEYYAALSALALGKNKESVELFMPVAQLIKDKEASVYADEMVYSYISALADSEIDEPEEFASDEVLDLYYKAYMDVYKETSAEALEEAVNLSEQILGKYDNLAYVYYIKGAAYYEQEKYEDARQAYEKAIECNSSDAMVWFALGETYSRLDNSEAAYNAYNMSDMLSPWYDYYSDYEGVGIHMYSYKEHELVNLQSSHEADNGEGE
ncbi:MAG: tetratricopeptide repeat protein [Lachnospiraceae bacterium]|nr:tetratricopeptide repeat protein [Lachnospiraceae bacterium]